MTTPKLSEIQYASSAYDKFGFRVSGVDTSFANALRRTILSDLDTVVINGSGGGGVGADAAADAAADAEAVEIERNTGRLHNEILKHRLGCIPVFAAGETRADMERFAEQYELVVDVTNRSADVLEVTTEHFQIRDRRTGLFLAAAQRARHFPPHPKTKDYVLFARLRPGIGTDAGAQSESESEGGAEDAGGAACIPPESLKLRARFAVSSARRDASHNVVSLCTYANTKNEEGIEETWTRRAAELAQSTEDLAFAKRNFMALEAQQICVPNSFDFSVRTLGTMTGREAVRRACAALLSRLRAQEDRITSDFATLIQETRVTIENGFDVKLVGEDHTLGNMLEFVGYQKYYLLGRGAERERERDGGARAEVGEGGGGEGEGDRRPPQTLLSFFGVKKMHPHEDHTVLRIGFSNAATKEDVAKVVADILRVAAGVVRKLESLFE